MFERRNSRVFWRLTDLVGGGFFFGVRRFSIVGDVLRCGGRVQRSCVDFLQQVRTIVANCVMAVVLRRGLCFV
jgi:hypothetical protein